MTKYINFSIFEIEYSKLLESNHNDLIDLSINNDRNTITFKIDEDNIDEMPLCIESYINKNNRSLDELLSIISFYLKSNKIKLYENMLELFINGPKKGNIICIFIYTLDEFIFKYTYDDVNYIYDKLGFDHKVNKIHKQLPKENIDLLKEGFKKYVNPKFKYINI